MRQIIQDLSSGTTKIVEVPIPRVASGTLLIQSTKSLVSIGTEKMLLEFASANIFKKATLQPEKVRAVLRKAKTDGLLTTFDAVKSKLDQPIPLGYCNVGRVLEVGKGVTEFSKGDRVVSNGCHAEIVRVPKNLCAKIPDSVDDDSAAFVIIGSIALQGVRLLGPTLGDVVFVMGLGLIGLITVQLLRSHGCRVLGADYDQSKLDLAAQFGAEAVDLSNGQDPISKATTFSRGRGVDGVIITASTKSSMPVHQAASMCRQRGRIIMVGVTGLELSRADFYEKELTFQVSCSYGPGRYDPVYETEGVDYPIGFVRWTEQRNFEAILDKLAEEQLDFNALTSHQFEFSRAEEGYRLLNGNQSMLGMLLDYGRDQPHSAKPIDSSTVVWISSDKKAGGNAKVVCSFIGAGNYASRILIPGFKKAGAALDTITTTGSVTGIHYGKKFGFAKVASDSDKVIPDDSSNAIVIATRHNTHAKLVCDALRSSKHVFVEKPLALTLQELSEIGICYQEQLDRGHSLNLMVGFNRRFAPHILTMKELLRVLSEPKVFIITVNAGEIPPDHWVQDDSIGGGRLIGEGCHFVDLMRFLADSPIVSVDAHMMGPKANVPVRNDKVVVTLEFDDGSFGSIHYLANGGTQFPKERIEVFAGGAVLKLNNFRNLVGYGWPGFKKLNLWRQDKGQQACTRAFVDSVSLGSPSPIPFAEIIEVSRATIDAADSLN